MLRKISTAICAAVEIFSCFFKKVLVYRCFFTEVTVEKPVENVENSC